VQAVDASRRGTPTGAVLARHRHAEMGRPSFVAVSGAVCGPAESKSSVCSPDLEVGHA
jgi:hypothetical protein